MRALCGSIFVVVGGWASAVAAPAPKGGDELEGTWAVMSAEKHPALSRLPEGTVWVIAGGKLSDGTTEGGGMALIYTLKVDAAKNPNQIDLVAEVGGRTVILRGIYRLDKGRLTVCLGVAAGDAKMVVSERPGAFEAGKNVLLLTLQRSKE